MKILTSREIEIQRVKLAMMKRDINITMARRDIAAMQKKNRACAREIARQTKLLKLTHAKP